MRVLVAMPVFNEANGIAEFVEEVALAMLPFIPTFIVADDCSTDSTLKVLSVVAETHQVEILPSERNSGHGPTTVRALHAALSFQPDVVVAVDGDGQFIGDDIRRLVNLRMCQGLDLVEGVRVGRNDPLFRRAISWLTRTLVQIRSGKRPLDANTPLRVYHPAVLKSLLQYVPSDAITPNLLISALSRDWKLGIREERVRSIPRRGGDSEGTTWRARRKSIPSIRFLKFCIRAAHQWFMPAQHSQ